MKVSSLFITTLSFVTLISCRAVPYLEDDMAVKRDEVADLPLLKFDLMARAETDLMARGIVSDILDSFNISSILGSINVESIAGWVNDLLVSNNNVQIVDDLLVGLKNTGLLPNAIIWILGNNFTLEIIESLTPSLLSFVGGLNSTGFFVALDRSGLAYSTVAGLLEDPATYSSVLEIVQKLLKSGQLNLSDLFSDVTSLFTRDEIWEEFNEQYKRDLVKKGIASDERMQAMIKRNLDAEAELQELLKRDNIDDLLTTIMGSISRAGLIPDLVHRLLTSDEFQDSAVSLIVGLLHNLGSLTKGGDFSHYKPLLDSIWNSGLIGNTVEKALADPNLLSAVVKNVVGLLGNGTLTARELLDDEELLKREDVQELLRLTDLQGKAEAEAKSSSVVATTHVKTSSSSHTKTASTSTGHQTISVSVTSSDFAAKATGTFGALLSMLIMFV